MNTEHIAIPVVPPVEVIEAMIETSLEHKNNVEKIYKTIVAHFVNANKTHCENVDPDQIMQLEIGTGGFTDADERLVTLTAYYGPNRKSVTGYISPRNARFLARDIIFRAAVAEGGI